MAAEVLQENKDFWVDTPRPSKYVQQEALTGGTAVAWTVPANVDLIRISYTAGTLWMRADGGTAVVPAAQKTDGTGSEIVLQGEFYNVEPLQVLSFINATTCVVSFACRKCWTK